MVPYETNTPKGIPVETQKEKGKNHVNFRAKKVKGP